jgi:pSer/pThr/pTyr-binding forkhead associated (FHA) protein
MARLVLLSEGLTGRIFELKVEKTTVGRVEDNTFQIAETSVSSHHAEIHLRGSEVVVKDLNSTNGTFINGEKVAEAVLKPGQILRLGMIEMRLETGDAAAPTGAAGATTSTTKKALDQTRVIPQGVKMDELEGTRPLTFGGQKGFEKKSNTATIVFIIIVILIGIALIGALVWVVVKPHG